ncbi:MAG TPA: NADH-quinone oxidoreductase subunit M [Gammaproteobacteria bacterium]|nr:NADH-quinone oxidoreductase subunit M [Gammaproteobacteria bacterium]
MNAHFLSILIWFPVATGFLMLLVPEHKRRIGFILALLVSVLELGFSLKLIAAYDRTATGMQLIERTDWIQSLTIQYYLGVDGIAVLLIVLTAIITLITILAAWNSVKQRFIFYLGSFLILEGFMIGVFVALDAILFYVFWEAMLLPMFLIIGVWGGPNRVYATIKFFLYTLLGSLLMLVAFIYLYQLGGSFSILDMQKLAIPYQAQVWLFWAFFMAFAVKVPMFPLHTWLPDAHVEAPTGGSVILASIMLKMGGFGFIRISLPVLPDASHGMAGIIIALSLIAVVYISLVALVQRDMKKLIAYSSISHMGFVTLGFFVFNQTALEGSIIQMVSHGFVAGAMFLCVGVLYDRVHSRQIADYGGVANTMPVFAGFTMLFAMANSGLPGTSGFVGEFLVIMGTFQVQPWFAAIAALTLILGAAYTLWMYKRAFFGKVANDTVATLKDINAMELLFLSLLAIMVLAIGLWPNPLLDLIHTSVGQLLSQSTATKLL